jgi:hypothetical protein
MLKHNEVNPLAVFGLRKLDHCPPHFTKIAFDLRTHDLKAITDWIWENLDGRFYFGDDYSNGEGNGVAMQKVAAFEIPGEASYFTLILDTINTHNNSVW